MKVFVGKLVLTDCESDIGPAVIATKNGKIVEVIKGTTDVSQIKGDVQEVVDAGYSLMMPGLVDSHVHVNEPGRTHWEGFASATKAAAAAGVTAIVDMPLNSIPPTTTVENFERKKSEAKDKCFVDVAFWGGVIPGNARELKPMLEKGVKGFKCFLIESGVEEFPCVSKNEAFEALTELQGTNGVLLFHAEIDVSLPQEQKGDPNKYATFLESRPPSMEDGAIEEIIEICRATMVPCHIVHLGSGNAVDIIERAQQEGLPLTVETCHHYLNLNAEDIPDASAQFKCCPPVRGRWHRERLWKALKQGVVSMVVSDHSPCTEDLKSMACNSLMSSWGGISSLQYGLPLMWSEGRKRGFTIQDILRLMSANTARFANLADRKGRIDVGFDADLVFWDPLETFTISRDEILHKNKLTPYLGWNLSGAVHRTYLRGQLVYANGSIMSDSPTGILLTA